MSDPAAPIADPAPAQPEGTPETFLLLSIAGEHFGLPTRAVREIRAWTEPTPLPGAERSLIGVINLRGMILAVVDAAERLGLPPPAAAPARPVIVVLNVDGLSSGLLADRVSDILALPSSTIEPAPLTDAQAAPDCIQGLAVHGGAILRLLSPAALLPHPPAATARGART